MSAFLQTRVTKGSRVAKARAILSAQKYGKNVAVSLLSSSVMSQLKSGSTADFSKILKMIDDMVALLGQEQKDDAKHRSWYTTYIPGGKAPYLIKNLWVSTIVDFVHHMDII
jgi:hypothetical protein